ncbi:hypothetical protein FZI85_17305 [Mycobacterium sp. CBMA293]|uniref:hypothetical protein n=1 Tax=unclassified Mycolicibacterium TaxID=2636767 RepID=UPI0012DF071B|nr:MULTISPECIES: hypothetical protein [unclassified Mycolicibacterium]MUL44480.1 hypothetical protein [Mycolicibacterium sp. CBMA 360]MUL59800.1 hypothetical protein [Mycolicibacterium sp. CBMA 335]MUL68643.1 hypothetical protein [Mycolicibacterium sp. CBMA 311]MUL93966.1 hypothetical protein [Mycolicibacterium sp. CBMA 230]MUM12774.1 hypothetical protein [Mycolicibacterium sp. CBMA 293]
MAAHELTEKAITDLIDQITDDFGTLMALRSTYGLADSIDNEDIRKGIRIGVDPQLFSLVREIRTNLAGFPIESVDSTEQRAREAIRWMSDHKIDSVSSEVDGVRTVAVEIES